jgi:hypothetical protein
MSLEFAYRGHYRRRFGSHRLDPADKNAAGRAQKETSIRTTKTLDPNQATGNDPAYQRARRRVHQLRGFYSNLFTDVVIVGALVVHNLLTDRTYLWVAWVALLWGIGIALHAFSTFARNGPLGADWEERKIGELMERESRGSN